MNVVADSSPLIILAKLNVFDLLRKLYPHLFISADVYAEVVVAGAGLPGAANVAKAEWIEVKPIHNPSELAAASLALASVSSARSFWRAKYKRD